MTLKELIRAVDELTSEEFETLYRHIREQQRHRGIHADQAEDHPSAPLNVAELT